MLHGNGYFQTGMTLIEVMIALVILSVGLLGAAAVQINALKYTDSAMLHSHASFAAYDILDRMRGNPNADYSLASLASAPSVANLSVPRDQDLFDFALNLNRFAGEDADARISLAGGEVEISITWNDHRAAIAETDVQTFTLNSRVAADRQVQP